jgi:hypothetical protein
VKFRHVCPTSAPAPVSHPQARLRLPGDTGSGTCVPPAPRATRT